jgi:hypothetical protein
MAQPEEIQWWSPRERMPDDDTTVLLWVPESDGEPVWPGHWSGEEWCWTCGTPVPQEVQAWADVPIGPQGTDA